MSPEILVNKRRAFTPRQQKYTPYYVHSTTPVCAHLHKCSAQDPGRWPLHRRRKKDWGGVTRQLEGQLGPKNQMRSHESLPTLEDRGGHTSVPSPAQTHWGDQCRSKMRLYHRHERPPIRTLLAVADHFQPLLVAMCWYLPRVR